MATGTTAEQIIDVVTPAAGESVSEGTILEWRVKVADFIKVNDTIVEISTDKVDLELPAPASGTVTEILVEEGDTVTVGQVIARIAARDAPDAASSDTEVDGQTAPQTATAAPAPAPASAPATAPDSTQDTGPSAAAPAPAEIGRAS